MTTVQDYIDKHQLQVHLSQVLELQLSRGLALSDIVKELHTWIFRISMPTFLRIQLIEALADLEYRLATGTHERLQLGALCASFAKARGELAAAAQ